MREQWVSAAARKFESFPGTWDVDIPLAGKVLAEEWMTGFNDWLNASFMEGVVYSAEVPTYRFLHPVHTVNDKVELYTPLTIFREDAMIIQGMVESSDFAYGYGEEGLQEYPALFLRDASIVNNPTYPIELDERIAIPLNENPGMVLKLKLAR